MKNALLSAFLLSVCMVTWSAVSSIGQDTYGPYPQLGKLDAVDQRNMQWLRDHGADAQVQRVAQSYVTPAPVTPKTDQTGERLKSLSETLDSLNRSMDRIERKVAERERKAAESVIAEPKSLDIAQRSEVRGKARWPEPSAVAVQSQPIPEESASEPSLEVPPSPPTLSPPREIPASDPFSPQAQEDVSPRNVAPQRAIGTWTGTRVTDSGKRDLTVKERRSLGITLPNLVAIGTELKSDGEIDNSTPSAEVAAAIVVRLKSKTPTVFKGMPVNDWQAVLSLIERQSPIIVDLLGLPVPGEAL